MFGLEAAALGPKLKDGERRGVVYIDGCLRELGRFMDHLLPLVLGQASFFYFFTFQLCFCRDEPVHQLQRGHL